MVSEAEFESNGHQALRAIGRLISGINVPKGSCADCLVPSCRCYAEQLWELGMGLSDEFVLRKHAIEVRT